jgi:hypothetical protein
LLTLQHSVWSVHTSTRPQFGPNTSAEYELDPVFKDVGLDMSVYGYLLPLLGHKVAPAADVPNSSAQARLLLKLLTFLMPSMLLRLSILKKVDIIKL